MSYYKIDEINCHYVKKGHGAIDVVLLHGWGQNTEMMEIMQDHLAKWFTVYNFDFPGFGLSDNPDRPWSPDDYCLWLEKTIKHFDMHKVIIIGHSFGGHIAMRYASSHDVYKLILTGAAGLKPKRGADYYFKVYSYKLSKQLFKLPIIKNYKEKAQTKFGSEDYQNTDGIMRQTFVKVVNSYVDDMVENIKCPTLLVYGDMDDATPLWMGQYLESKIPNAGLAVFEGQGHYAYYVQAVRFNAVLDAFLKEDQC